MSHIQYLWKKRMLALKAMQKYSEKKTIICCVNFLTWLFLEEFCEDRILEYDIPNSCKQNKRHAVQCTGSNCILRQKIQNSKVRQKCVIGIAPGILRRWERSNDGCKSLEISIFISCKYLCKRYVLRQTRNSSNRLECATSEYYINIKLLLNNTERWRYT